MVLVPQGAGRVGQRHYRVLIFLYKKITIFVLFQPDTWLKVNKNGDKYLILS